MISSRRAIDAWLRRVDYCVDGEPLPRMTKWILFSSPWLKIFLHKFNGPDWSLDPHDHPADFISVGLRGSYVEAVYDDQGQVTHQREWRAPWFRTFPAKHIHRTVAVGPRGALTVCLAGPFRQQWSFFIGRDRLEARNYVRRFRSRRSDKPDQRGSSLRPEDIQLS